MDRSSTVLRRDRMSMMIFFLLLRLITSEITSRSSQGRALKLIEVGIMCGILNRAATKTKSFLHQSQQFQWFDFSLDAVISIIILHSCPISTVLKKYHEICCCFNFIFYLPALKFMSFDKFVNRKKMVESEFQRW